MCAIPQLVSAPLFKTKRLVSMVESRFTDACLRAAVCKYREFAVKTEIWKFFIFSQKKPFGETCSKITIKVSKEFCFSRKPAKSEMLPHAI